MVVALEHPELVASLTVADIAPVAYGVMGEVSRVVREAAAAVRPPCPCVGTGCLLMRSLCVWGEGGAQVAAMAALDLAVILTRADADAALAATIPDVALRAFVCTNLTQAAAGGGGGAATWAWRVNLPVLMAELPRMSGFVGAAERGGRGGAAHL